MAGGLAFMVGIGSALLTNLSAGCIIPDECILVTTAGKDWCRYLSGARMWPVGNPEAAVDVKDAEGAWPEGCTCFNTAEAQILQTAAPVSEYVELTAEVELAVRHQCDWMVPAGYDHNCYQESGPGAPTVESVFPGATGSCVGDCAYTDDCGDPNPYECECILDGGCGGGETGGGETGGTGETGGEDLDAGTYITCARTSCEIDAAFAAMLWDDPSLLLTESTRFIYDPAVGRFVFSSVSPGSVAAVLGFQSGDVLESVGGVVIDDLDTALQVFSAHGDATFLRVRVLRGSRWIDLAFSFV